VTAADVVVAVLLAAAAARTKSAPLGPRTDGLLHTILTNATIRAAIGDEGVSKEEMRAAGGAVPQLAAEMDKLSVGGAGGAGGSAAEGKGGPVPTAAELAANPLVLKLAELGLTARTYGHVPCMTADELVASVPLPSASHSHTKNLFFKDKKHGLYLLTTTPAAVVDTKSLGRDLLKLEGKVNLRLASEEVLMAKLGCARGCVGPLAIANNAERDVTLVLDENLLQAEGGIHSHPLRNDASTVLTAAQLGDYLARLGVEPVVVDFPQKGGGDGGAEDRGREAEQRAGKPPASRPKADKKAKPKIPKKDKKDGAPKAVNKDKKQVKKGETLLALQWKKEENFPMWYSDVIVLSEMISYYDISGCYILRPWSYKMWELIQEWFNAEIRKLDVENSYFPLFVSQDRLEKEKDHVEGFAPEVAWVTKSGDGDLNKPIAVRPTSETIMYPAFSDWIKSHRDLPLKLNQWSNVVRWEFKDPTPFLRTREFLWQEGHTAHESHADADVMVMQALDLYRQVYEDLLAIPVIPGYKTEKEKFAGGHQTTTVEAYIPMSGRAIQGATSHNLGQNFGKMFDITYQDAEGKSQIAWQTSWGLTTRTLGVMIMVHGDDTGLVLPPRIAPLQAVIVPIVSKKMTMADVAPYCKEILQSLLDVGIRAKFDDRDTYNPGWKYNHWEQKGVPVRIEVGPRDIEAKQARMVVRSTGDKTDHATADLAQVVKDRLAFIQTDMLERARAVRDSHLVRVTEWKDFVPEIEKHNLVLTPWCGGEHQDWEEWVKEKSREESLAARGEEGEDERTATSVAAKTLCIPFKQPDLPEGTKCFASGLPAKCWVLWGRSY